MPDVCYMTFALNIIGACPYFLKLAISPDALAEETKDCKLAIVFDQMWENVKGEFSKDRFETVIVARITDAMPVPKKQIVSVLLSLKGKADIPKEKKYISVPDARKLAEAYDGEVKASFVPNRNAFITSSSGTTVGGIVKGVIATNETILSILSFEIASGQDKFTKLGDRVLNNFPPTAATSLLSLFLLPLYCGETIVMDPRVGEDDFYNQLIKLRPNVVLTTGIMWEAFFARIEKEKKKIKLEYASQWICGGEGAEASKIKQWDRLIRKDGGNGLLSGYGQSELFSTVTCEAKTARYDYSRSIMSVGIPLAGITVGIFDKDGKELGYNQRGELRLKGKSVMKGYYNKPDLTEQTKVDGWIKTGDLAEIDENGFVYVWGRVNDSTLLPDGREIYLFDIANKLKEKKYVDDAIVLEKPIKKNSISLVAHIVWDKSAKEDEKGSYLKELVECVEQYEPEVELIAFAIHDVMLPYSPTTLKKDKNRMMNQTDGFVRIVDDQIRKIHFVQNGNGLYSMDEST